MIQHFERVHDQFTDLQRLHLTLAGRAKPVLDLINLCLDALHRDGALLQRSQEPGAKLLLIKGLSATVLLDHTRQNQFGCFISGETLGAAQTFPATTHLRTLRHETRVNHFRFIGAAKRAMHNRKVRL